MIARIESDQEEPKGIACKHCGCRHLEVDYTRPMEQSRFRKRICRNCRRPVYTIEKVIEA